MVSSRSLSEVVSSQGRFIATKKEQLLTPSRSLRAPRGPPPSLLARLLQAPLPRRRSAARSSFPRCSPAGAQDPALATPPRRAGPLRHGCPPWALSRPRLPGTVWLSIGSYGGADPRWPMDAERRRQRRGNAAAHLEAPSGTLALTCFGGSGRWGESARGGRVGRGLPGFGPSLTSRDLFRRVSIRGLKNNR